MTLLTYMSYVAKGFKQQQKERLAMEDHYPKCNKQQFEWKVVDDRERLLE